MHIQSNVPLKDYSTMHLGGPARYLATMHNKAELVEAVDWATTRKLPILVLGEGSNIIVRDEGFGGLVIINRITGFEIIKDLPNNTIVQIGAGEHWDTIVSRTVDLGLSGIEKLSMIPGTAGATPVQNVGAYGAEIADTFVELEAYNLYTKKNVVLKHNDCQFSYRHSIFKPPGNRHYIITSIILKLSKGSPKPPFYKSLQQYLDTHNITDFTPKTIRQAVIAIRASILPDPKLIANTGSFFKNPIVSQTRLSQLLQDYPDLPYYELPDNQAKLSAGWFIDQAGLKGYHAHGMKIYDQNALVFVNASAKTYKELATFKTEVIAKIQTKFGISLEQEPETI